jgi:predicted transcriptional regulator YdeE
LINKHFVNNFARQSRFQNQIIRNAKAFDTIQNYIYTEWLPASNYELDNRPQFEILGVKYKTNDPNSEEEIWIPIGQCNNLV